ncbi:MAG: Uma2 family endonuclease [Chloroflexota bacterium]
MAIDPNEITADEFWKYRKHNKHSEFIEGSIFQLSPNNWMHGDITSELNMRLRAYVKKNNLGLVTSSGTGYRLTKYTVVAPDCGFIAKERIP